MASREVEVAFVEAIVREALSELDREFRWRACGLQAELDQVAAALRDQRAAERSENEC